ncbi:MAG: pantoate--beta-alanine ligase [Longimicrobiales bacterium]
MILCRTRVDLVRALDTPRIGGARIGLVPTMGYLHEGHLSLVDLARQKADFVAVSIFVNPLQFGAGEDLDRYPRDLERDFTLLEDRWADLVFHPSVEEMYPANGPLVTVDPGPMGDLLCGAFRPGHFRGVLTVVARLFGLFRPQLAVFGQKDYQQGVLIRRMVEDLELNVDVHLSPVVREPDGLAMSSRNVFLSDTLRSDALGLYQGLLAVQEAFSGGQTSHAALQTRLRATVSRRPGLQLQYGEIVDPLSLRPVDPVPPGAVVAVAALCGPTRLIDNHILAD